MKTLLRIVVSLSFLWAAEDARALTLDEAVRKAAENSHDLRILKLESAAASWNETKAMAGYLPKLDLEARHLTAERFEEIDVAFGGQDFSMPAIQPYSSLGVGASLNLFNGLRTTNELQAARLETRAADERLRRAQDQKRAEIRTLFSRALGSRILLEVADQNIETLETHVNDVNARIRAGVSTRYDLLRTEVLLEEARTEKIAAENGTVIARARLFEAIGLPDDGLPLEGKLADDFTRIQPAKIAVETGRRSDREALIADRDRRERLSAAARAHWMPSLSLFGNYEWYNNTNHSVSGDDQKFKSAYNVGLRLSWSLFDGGADYAAQRQAALAGEVAAENLARFDQGLPVALEDAKRRFSYDVITYNAKLSSIRKATEAVRLARGGLRAGTRTNTEVLDAVVDLNRARAAAVKSQVDAIEALGLLELSVGHAL